LSSRRDDAILMAMPMRIDEPTTIRIRESYMKRSLFLVPAIAFGLLAGQGAFAQPKGGPSESQPAAPSKSSQRTRAEVKAECDAARKAGTMPAVECQGADPNVKSTKSRAEVKAECDAARKSGAALKAECGPN
jgi:hypothetical protein